MGAAPQLWRRSRSTARVWVAQKEMTETERTAGGPLGRIAGKLKEAAGSAVGNDELAREGRLQQAQVDAAEEAVGEAAEARQQEAEAALEEERARTAQERE